MRPHPLGTSALSTVPFEKKKRNPDRIPFLDTAKMMAIFAVCYAHICGGDFSVTLIDYFSLGVFFIVAGMTLVPERYENFGQFLWRKVKSYVIPILCMDVITIIINVSFLLVKGQMDQITITYFFDELVHMLCQYRYFALWVVTSIFFSVIFTYLLVKHSHKKWFLEVPLLALTLLIALLYNHYFKKVLYWNFDTVFLGTFLTYFGYLLYHRAEAMKSLCFEVRVQSLILGIIFLALGLGVAYLTRVHFGRVFSFYAQDYGIYYLTIPAVLFASLGIIMIARGISNPIMSNLGKANICTLTLQQSLILPLMRNTLFPDWWHKILAITTIDNIQRALFGLTGASIAVLAGYILYLILLISPLSFAINKKPLPFYPWSKEYKEKHPKTVKGNE